MVETVIDKVKLRSPSAAILFSLDNEAELILDEKEQLVTESNKQALAVMYALRNKEIRSLIEQYFDKKCLQIKIKAKLEKEYSEQTLGFKEDKSNLVYLSDFKKQQAFNCETSKVKA